MSEDINALVRRFEPILIFEEFERFFPSDAKRYIERCALWYSDLPLDEKESWGGRGKPFPRLPLLDYGKIAASNAPGEVLPGTTFLGDELGFIDAAARKERFLDLGGWRGGSKVTQTSENRRAEIELVHNLYFAELKGSQFWYHAEFFDTDRLGALVEPYRHGLGLNLAQVLDQFSAQHPALLCYYFFYPCHEESLPSPCDNDVPGKDYATYAGEWQCMAILLGREDVNQRYLPKYFGFTGRFDREARQALGGDRRIGMSVIRWQPKDDPVELLPQTVADHPQLWVSRGVHSFYLQPGVKSIDPYPRQLTPVDCGSFDSPDALADYADSDPFGNKDESEGSPAAAWAKIIAGGLLGGLGGLVAGAILTALEGLPTGLAMGYDGVATGSPPPPKPFPDVVEEPGQFNGVIAGPKALGLNNQLFPGADFIPWAADQNVKIGTRQYDFLVDRQTQIWWPSDDGGSGYFGRWGPLVVDDRYQRRSGMGFPEFWNMFFVALAKSQEDL